MKPGKIKKQFHKTLKELKRKGFYVYDCYMSTAVSVWYPKKDVMDYRFQMLPKMYRIVEKYWDEEHAPFVMETLYMMETWCHRWKYDNLIGMLVVDLVSGDTSKDFRKNERLFGDKLGIMYAAFYERTKQERTGASLLTELNLDYRRVFHIAALMHEKSPEECMKYFDQVVEPLIKEIIKHSAHSELFQGFAGNHPLEFSLEECRMVAEKMKISDELNEEVIHFLIENVLCYVYACDCHCYNPYWIFGSRHYKKLMKRIWNYDYTWEEITE